MIDIQLQKRHFSFLVENKALNRRKHDHVRKESNEEMTTMIQQLKTPALTKVEGPWGVDVEVDDIDPDVGIVTIMDTDIQT